MVDSSSNCSQAFYFNSTMNDEMMPERIHVVDGNPISVFINMNLTIGKSSILFLFCSLIKIFEITTETDNPVDPELVSPMCAEKNYGTLDTVNNDVILIAITTAIGVVLIFIIIVVLSLIVAYFCWKRRIKVQKINFTKKNNLQSWSHHHNHEHQEPSTESDVSDYYSYPGLNVLVVLGS